MPSGRKPKTLATTLTAVGERHVRAGHPWVYTDSIERIKGEEAASPGDLAVMFDRRRDRFLAVGLYDPASPIRIKVLHQGQPARVGPAFFRERIAAAKAFRGPLLATDTNSYRLLNGENDGFPGLIADVYAEVLVVKVYSEIWVPWLDTFQAALLQSSGCTTLVLRLSRGMQQSAVLPEGWKDGAVLHVWIESPEVDFHEHGVVLTANVIKGHKTGFFLDHRHNRRRVGELAAGKRVLDIFSYAGGFAVHALVGGATSVTALDISAQALELAKANAARNGVGERLTTVAGDAFLELEKLQKKGQRYDLIIVDPPSFAKRAAEVPGAVQAYRRLTRLAIPLVAPGGILLLASCSARVSAEDFYSFQLEELQHSDREYKELDRTGHDVDHPVSFPEGSYLKSIYIKLS